MILSSERHSQWIDPNRHRGLKHALSRFYSTGDGLRTEMLCLTSRIFSLLSDKIRSPQDASCWTQTRVSSTNFELIEVYVGIVADINSCLAWLPPCWDELTSDEEYQHMEWQMTYRK